ncbi:MAG: hypothetical protein PVS3B3_04260 [Ktedonobacteraceae bacterium]
MLDKATVLTTLFTIVDDTMKGSAMIQQVLQRPGPSLHLSDSEVITIALYQELIGEPREDHFLRLPQANVRTFFPELNERSCYTRRKRGPLVSDPVRASELTDRAGCVPAGRGGRH